YLRIADELYLKRLIVGGFERVYEIGHDFRNEGMDRTHNPEFTLLEWYQAYADYIDMLEMVEEMVSGIVQACLGGLAHVRRGIALNFAPPYRRVSFCEGIQAVCGLDVLAASEDELRTFVAARGETLEAVGTLSGGRLLDEVFKQSLEPTLVQPSFVLDYPKAL